jgi:hypothetical protein
MVTFDSIDRHRCRRAPASLLLSAEQTLSQPQIWAPRRILEQAETEDDLPVCFDAQRSSGQRSQFVHERVALEERATVTDDDLDQLSAVLPAGVADELREHRRVSRCRSGILPRRFGQLEQSAEHEAGDGVERHATLVRENDDAHSVLRQQMQQNAVAVGTAGDA